MIFFKLVNISVYLYTLFICPFWRNLWWIKPFQLHRPPPSLSVNCFNWCYIFFISIQLHFQINDFNIGKHLFFIMIDDIFQKQINFKPLNMINVGFHIFDFCSFFLSNRTLWFKPFHHTPSFLNKLKWSHLTLSEGFGTFVIMTLKHLLANVFSACLFSKNPYLF